MGTEVATQDNQALGTINITPEQVSLVKTTVFPNSTDDELKLYFFECRRRGVHPLDRLVIPVKRQDKLSFQTSIDLFRSQAEETGEYRGQDDIDYGPMMDFPKVEKKIPEYAKATVMRYDEVTGQTIKVSAVAYWDEYYPGESLGFQWRKMPRLMLGKCAEALALRKAFPRKLAGLYTFEEMQLTDLVEQGNKLTKSSTVKPGNGGNQKNNPLKDDNKPLKDKLKDELAAYCGNDPEKMAATLKEISLFSADGKEKWISDIDKASDKWCGTALGSLRKLTDKGEDYCNKDGEKCNYLIFEGETPSCSKKEGACEYI